MNRCYICDEPPSICRCKCEICGEDPGQYDFAEVVNDNREHLMAHWSCAEPYGMELA